MKKTPLYEWHVANGGNMADFSGYEMPIWYTAGIKEEHMSVLLRAGIFDTSHMAVATVNGPGAFDLLQHCLSKDLTKCVGLKKAPISNRRCVYGVFLNENGEVLDDAITYQLDENRFMIVVNAGMGKIIASHLAEYKNSHDVKITNLTDKVAKMDIQGPMSAVILSKLLKNPERVFSKIPYFSFKGHFDPENKRSKEVTLQDGAPLLLSRTGYTGEFGFEIFINPEHIVSLWENILEIGAEFNIKPCGLGSRDSLRTGAVLPLSHQDIGHWPFINHPWSFALPYNDDLSGFTKGFIGSKVLQCIEKPDYTYGFTGYDARKVSAGENAEVIDGNGDIIGSVLTCATDMGIGRVDSKIVSITSPDKPEDYFPKGLSCGFVKVDRPFETKDALTLREGKRKIEVEIRNDIRPYRSARIPLREML